jgi:peptide/nickel transport system substrate-binding protein
MCAAGIVVASGHAPTGSATVPPIRGGDPTSQQCGRGNGRSRARKGSALNSDERNRQMLVRTRHVLVLSVAVLALVLAIAVGGATAGSSAGGSGILRIGTTNYIDSLNPFNYIEAQAYNAMIMLYPQLVQYAYTPKRGYYFEGDWAKSWKVSSDGKTWTFRLRPNTKWSDGEPLTADDAAWAINTTVKYADGATAVLAASLNHVQKATAVNPTTLVIRYASPVGNVLAQLEQFFVVPRHVYEPLAKKQSGGKAIKTFHPEQKLPMVTAGAYTLKQYEKKGTNVFIPDPNFWGPKSNADAVALTFFTNSDSMIADLKRGELEWVDQVPFNAVNVVDKFKNVKVNKVPGAETTNITWNSNPRKPKNRELLDPRVKKALSMCVDRNKMIDVVFQGYATKVESLVGHISPLENPNLGPLKYNCGAANKALDSLGYKRGADGTRVAPATTGKYAQDAHPMSYEIVTPTSADFNINRMFDIVQEGFAKLGVKAKQRVGGDATATYALETDSNCDAAKSTGYAKFDIAMWDWIGYIDPDFMLSVVTKGQWCSWSDTGWDSPAYDRLYERQGTTVNPAKRKAIVWKMQKLIYDNFLYTQLTNHVYIDAYTTKWTGFKTELNAYSKAYYTSPKKR